MARDTRVLKIEADEDLGQFVDVSVESLFAHSTENVKVTELDPNNVPDYLLE